jgi:hypothetical protein
MGDRINQAGTATPGGHTRTLGTLVIERPHGSRGLVLPVPAPEAVIGRRDGDVRLDSALVSRRHAVIWSADGQVWLRDEGSVNGTYVDGIRITEPRALLDGNHIRFGDVSTVFTTGDSAAAPARGVDSVGSAQWRAQTETTRYLCAAAHLDRRYRTIVLEATVWEKQRAVCPSYGVDLSVVARHAVVAERRELLRDAFLTVVLGLAVAVPAALVLTGPARLTAFVGALAILITMALGAVALETSARLATLGRMLQLGGRPDDLPSPPGPIGAVLQELAEANDGNVIVFTVFDPFIGSGTVVDAGSFTVPLIPQEERLRERSSRLAGPLRSGEVIDALTGALRGLREPYLRVEPRVYVNGYDVAMFPDLLPDPLLRPRIHAPSSLLHQTIELPTGNVRPYLCAEFTCWHGQLVVTSFIRVATFPGVLYVEIAAYLLPPLKASYYTVDELRIRTTGERLTATIKETTVHWFPALLASPFRLAAAANDRLAAARRERLHERRVADHLLIDYGAVTSIRERASGGHPNYFMEQDTDMYVKVVQQKVVDTIMAVLDAHGYETDKIKQIQNNTSVNFLGGSPTVGAIGQHAQGDARSPRDRGRTGPRAQPAQST